MEIIKREFEIVSQKILPYISPVFAKMYDIPEDHHSVVFFSATNDDPCFLALDDATKKVDIKVLRAQPHYGGMPCSWSKNSGCVFNAFSAPTVEKAKTAMAYIKDFVEHRSGGYSFDGKLENGFYAQVVAKVGKYYSQLLQVPEGISMAYLLGPPAEACYALDRAIKSSNVELATFFEAPSYVNSGGGIVVGKESACQAAKEAFIEGLRFAVLHPVNL